MLSSIRNHRDAVSVDAFTVPDRLTNCKFAVYLVLAVYYKSLNYQGLDQANAYNPLVPLYFGLNNTCLSLIFR